MRNYTLTSVWGIPLRINISLIVFLPILAWIIGSGTQIGAYATMVDALAPTTVDVSVLTGGSNPWLIGVAAAVGLFVSVALHELGHAWAARRYGIGTRDITLWLLGGIASLERMPREWNQELWIALAGPATSVLTAVGCYAVLFVLPASTPVTVFVFGWLVITNLVLTVFNLLPAFPMDGGRVLRALLARSRPYESATRTAVRFGTGFAVLFAVVGVLSFAPMLILLSLFLYGAASSESKTVMLQGLLADVTVGDIATFDVEGIAADATLAELGERMLRDRRTAYPVVEDGTVVGVVTLESFRNVEPERRSEATVRSITATDVPRVGVATAAFDGLAAINQSREGVALVESEGSVVGLVSLDEFTAFLQFREDSAGIAPRTAR